MPWFSISTAGVNGIDACYLFFLFFFFALVMIRVLYGSHRIGVRVICAQLNWMNEACYGLMIRLLGVLTTRPHSRLLKLSPRPRRSH